jgi:hypothetical protein
VATSEAPVVPELAGEAASQPSAVRSPRMTMVAGLRAQVQGARRDLADRKAMNAPVSPPEQE